MLIRTMPDLRKPVTDAMKRQDVSTYRLVQLLKGKRPKGADVPAQTVYEFIRGETEINSADLGLIFDALNIDAVSRLLTPSPSRRRHRGRTRKDG